MERTSQKKSTNYIDYLKIRSKLMVRLIAHWNQLEKLIFRIRKYVYALTANVHITAADQTDLVLYVTEKQSDNYEFPNSAPTNFA